MPTQASSRNRPGTYVFDRFRLSADGTLLREQDAAVAVAPKVLRTLLVLVERAGEVVTKEDLLQAVWPDSFVEETGLTRNISLLRQALGDDGQRFIVTVPRIGYRFVAPVERIEAPAGSPRTGGMLSVPKGSPGRPDAGATLRRVPLASSTRQSEAVRTWRGRLIIGHEQERAALHAAFDATRDGSGRLIAVIGEPGIGKSTIVEEFLSELTAPCVVGRGRCSGRLAGAEPHFPILEAIDELLTGDRTLAALLRRLAPTWYVHLAPRRSDGSSELRLPEDIPAGSAERLIRELTVFLEEIARSTCR